MTKVKLLNISLLWLVNLLIPGAGLIYKSCYWHGFITQLLLIVFVVTLSWSRLILDHVGIKIFLVGLTGVYIYSNGVYLFYSLQPSTNKSGNILRSGFYTISFVVFMSTLLVAGFVYKNTILGLQVYFIPSNSMYPALLPGDFVMVDTWIYNKNKPSINDIVVFNLTNKNNFLVKRISYWPKTKITEKNQQWYLLGDNSSISKDSREFGGITLEQIKGKASQVIFSLDKYYSVKVNRLLVAIE